MKNALIAVAALVFAGSAMAQSGQVNNSGKIENNTTVGTAVQNTAGIANKAKLSVGSVEGNVKNSGTIKNTTKVGTVVQNTAGIANDAQINIGGVAGSK